MFIKPNGAAASFLLEGATTNLKVDINGTTVTVSTDITKSSLTVAPGSNNTALLNDALAAAQHTTRYWGEEGCYKQLIIDNAGANVTSQVGKFCAFKTGTEYFLGYLESSTLISHCFRGYFYDSSYAPLNRVALTDNDVITIMSLGWVFIENNGTTVDVTYNNPVWAQVSPSGPTTGDYWYDLDSNVWKRYDGAAYQIINRTLIGLVVIDSANAVAARSFDFYQQYSSENTVDLGLKSTSVVRTNGFGQIVNVLGKRIYFGSTLVEWDMASHLAAAADMFNSTEQASTDYFFYVSSDGTKKICDMGPHWRPDLLGFYHPHNPWRCVGAAKNDGSSNLTEPLMRSTWMNHGAGEVAMFRDEKALNTAGGGSAAGNQTRVLNTSYVPAGALWTILDGSNQFYLAAGEYDIYAEAPCVDSANLNKIRLINVTDAATFFVGQNSYVGVAGGSSTLKYRFKISAPKIFSIQHYTSGSTATHGLGFAINNVDLEVYTQVHIRKIK